MKLLFDQNLSPGLVDRLADVFPDSSHVETEELGQATDDEIWAFAHARDYTIVTKDADFGDIVALRGGPPKVVWLRLGNCTTTLIEAKLRSELEAIHHLGESAEIAILSLT